MIFDDPTLEWSFWDYRLVKALVLYDNLQQGTGVPLYIDRSDRVRFEVGSYTSRSQAALDKAEEKAKKKKDKAYGKVFYPIPITVDGGPLPTLEDFLDEQDERKQMMAGNIRIAGEFSNQGWEPGD